MASGTLCGSITLCVWPPLITGAYQSSDFFAPAW